MTATRHLVAFVAGLLLAQAGVLQADTLAPSTLALLRELKPLTDDVARYRHLSDALPTLPEDQRSVARQMLASVESDLGLYAEALADFPFGQHAALDEPLSPAGWRERDAADAITRLAHGRRLVMINETHHDPRTRLLTLALLPRLKAEGFTHLAIEALGDQDATLATPGYPLRDSGSEYLREPLYGEIVREALRLGFILVPYEVDTGTFEEREAGQARNLYRKVFQGHPEARLFVHAGPAHIDKAKGRLGNAVPMAAQLARLSGIEPLSIDQSLFRESTPFATTDGAAATPAMSRAFVLMKRDASGRASAFWSDRPELHDVSVILPPLARGDKRDQSGSAPDGHRPSWLDLGGRRAPLPIDASLCAGMLPCLVEAFHADEPDEAVAADRYLLSASGTRSALYLFPGRYRLRARDPEGKTLAERSIEIAARTASSQ
jgi:hypothetical protein